MTDVVLVAVKLEHEGELRCFCIVAFHQNALCIKLFTENRRCKVGCDLAPAWITNKADRQAVPITAPPSVQRI